MQAQERIEVVPLSLIVPGDNPRAFFDEGKLEELAKSIKDKGVLQPILLRTVSDGAYKIVAGERRFRAATMVGLEGIPATILDNCSDERAEEIALTENTIRDDMSPTEEGRAASKLVDAFGGNLEEVASRLGWTINKLKSRLALTNCTPEVQAALDERRILLGHAEILAAVPKDKQNGVLERILESNFSVAYVRDSLSKIAQKLSSAPFDTAGCLSCSYNSAAQKVLFTTALDEGYCTNKECFGGKCKEKVDSLVEELSADHQKVVVINPGDKEQGIHLLPDGPLGVGVEQAVTCRSCANFGVTVSLVPGKVGEVEQDICFDPVCHQGKVAARIKEEKKKEDAKAGANGGESKDKNGKSEKPGSAKPKTSVSLVGSKVSEYRVKLWRKAAKAEVMLAKGPALSLLIALAANGRLQKISADSVKEITGEADIYGNKIVEKALASEAVEPEVREAAIQSMVASAMESLSENDLVQCLEFLGVDLSKHWKAGNEFFELLTKTQIEGVSQEIGLKEHMGKEWAKIISKKKGEIIQAITSAKGFEFEGKVPGIMQYGDSKAA